MSHYLFLKIIFILLLALYYLTGGKLNLSYDRDSFFFSIGLGMRILMTAESQASLAHVAIALTEDMLECLQGLGQMGENI